MPVEVPLRRIPAVFLVLLADLGCVGWWEALEIYKGWEKNDLE